ncbi:MAG: CopG family transcriptional regulator [Candidatus Aminicenantes bacterium]|jgi:predicted CopG family antitoxin|nr:CopG family transcriptional regulator [Candidatus Aminicenantes bacterium]
MDKEYTPVEIPSDLYKQIEEKIKKSEVSSVADFITKLLKDNLPIDQPETDSLSSEDEEKVKERLKALGYMD